MAERLSVCPPPHPLPSRGSKDAALKWGYHIRKIVKKQQVLNSSFPYPASCFYESSRSKWVLERYPLRLLENSAL